MNRILHILLGIIPLMVVLCGAGWLIYTTPFTLVLTAPDVKNLVTIFGIGVGTVIAAKLLEKPFDNWMDQRYPADIPPSKNCWRNC